MQRTEYRPLPFPCCRHQQHNLRSSSCATTVTALRYCFKSCFQHRYFKCLYQLRKRQGVDLLQRMEQNNPRFQSLPPKIHVVAPQDSWSIHVIRESAHQTACITPGAPTGIKVSTRAMHRSLTMSVWKAGVPTQPNPAIVVSTNNTPQTSRY